MKFLSLMLGRVVDKPVLHIMSQGYKYNDSIYPIPDGMTDAEIAAAIERSGGSYPDGCGVDLAKQLDSLNIFVDSDGTSMMVWVGDEDLRHDEGEDDFDLVQHAIDYAVWQMERK